MTRHSGSNLLAFTSSCQLYKQFHLNKKRSCPRTIASKAGSYKTGKAINEVRVFQDATLAAGTVHKLAESESRHLRARRIPVGTRVTVFNGTGTLATGMLQVDNQILILGVTQESVESQSISAVIGLTKSPSRTDWAVEKLTELGIRSIFFVTTERVVSHSDPGNNRTSRWRNVSIAAAKQSLRTDTPEVGYFSSLAEVVPVVKSYDLVLLLSPGGEPLLSHTCLQMIQEAKRILVIAGPEGGLTGEEENVLEQAGAKRIGLGANRLRVETAIVTSVAVLSQVTLLASESG